MWVEIAAAGVLGLLFGSFLNVVIHRLPKMMEADWQAEAAALRGEDVADAPAFNLLVPRSRCPKCGHMIAWHENIPLLSYVKLGGKCANCKTSIGIRYPLVELFTGLGFAYLASRFGLTTTAAVWALFFCVLLACALIDWDTTLLPDDLTLPLVWAGLIAAAMSWNPGVRLIDSLWGAVAGYLSLWAVYWAFKLLTGKEGMGYGDFKLFAALGAWFGWMGLVPIILMASVIGAIVGIIMKMNSALREGGYVPFGPFLAGAGLVAMVFGPMSILRAVGLAP
jgi:leader peptidase (prepilin peptidase)/N-methyltransferase